MQTTHLQWRQQHQHRKQRNKETNHTNKKTK